MASGSGVGLAVAGLAWWLTGRDHAEAPSRTAPGE
jgi:hypothetical protein